MRTKAILSVPSSSATVIGSPNSAVSGLTIANDVWSSTRAPWLLVWKNIVGIPAA
jgi:hypothetical protein